jgi:hypothetical protein
LYALYVESVPVLFPKDKLILTSQTLPSSKIFKTCEYDVELYAIALSESSPTNGM